MLLLLFLLLPLLLTPSFVLSITPAAAAVTAMATGAGATEIARICAPTIPSMSLVIHECSSSFVPPFLYLFGRSCSFVPIVVIFTLLLSLPS